MKVLVTGAYGFIGKNLTVRLNEIDGISVVQFGRDEDVQTLDALIREADAVVHLAGENRPKNAADFERVNVGLTENICNCLIACEIKKTVIFASSTQAVLDNPYGKSKLSAEKLLQNMANASGHDVVIYRLPNVFGKWCKPDYNSVVATFCHKLARGETVEIHDDSRQLDLVYVDDVVNEFLSVLKEGAQDINGVVSPVYSITLGQLASQLVRFENVRTDLVVENVGVGLERALYATYVSYLPKERFSYSVPFYSDERGVFSEMLKTKNAGQFSFFTAGKGITRGGHYHHTKTEKFLVVKGKARFKFRHVLTDEKFEVVVEGESFKVVETIPGWSHDVTNVGDEELVVMLWANEIFDRENPDTISSRV